MEQHILRTIGIAALWAGSLASAQDSTVALKPATEKTEFEQSIDLKPLDGAKKPARFRLDSGKLPEGIVLDEEKGQLSGTPAQPGLYAFRIGACGADWDVRHCRWQEYRLTVNIDFSSIPAVELYPPYDGQRKIAGKARPSTEKVAVKLQVLVDGVLMLVREDDKQAWSTSVKTDTEGFYRAEFEAPLEAGQQVLVREAAHPEAAARVDVAGRLDWGRSRASFAFGGVLSRDNGEFSKIDPYLGFTLDTAWRFADPGFYYPAKAKENHWCACDESRENTEPAYASEMIHSKKGNSDKKESDHRKACSKPPQSACVPMWKPANSRWLLNSFFIARLTSIPISTGAAEPTATPAASSGTPATPTVPSVGTLDSFLASSKAGEFGLGIVNPWLLTQWPWNRDHHALYIGPLARAGVLTPTSSDFATANGRLATQRLYNYFGFGARFGQFRMPTSRNTAPRETWRLDLTWGRYSNLRDIYGKTIEKFGDQKLESLYTTTPWRLVFDGFVTIPRTPFFIGYNANIGLTQNSGKLFNEVFKEKAGTVYEQKISYIRPARDDIRIIFGARLDVADLLGRMGVGKP